MRKKINPKDDRIVVTPSAQCEGDGCYDITLPTDVTDDLIQLIQRVEGVVGGRVIHRYSMTVIVETNIFNAKEVMTSVGHVVMAYSQCLAKDKPINEPKRMHDVIKYAKENEMFRFIHILNELDK